MEAETRCGEGADVIFFRMASVAAVSSSSRPFTLTDALLVTMSCIWGVNYSVVKYGTSVLRPLAYNGVRVALAAAILVVAALLTRRSRPSKRDALSLLGLGVLGNGLYQLLFAEGVAHTRAGNAALVLAAAPAFIALIGRALGVETIQRRQGLGIALSIAGIGLVVFGRTEGSAGATLFGDALVLAGALSWSLFSVLLKPLAHRVDLVTLSALTMLGGAIPLVAISMPSILATSWTQVAPLTWLALLYSGVGALVIAYFFWYRGVRTLGPTRTAIYSNLQPVVALLFAWVALREVPTLWQSVGAGTIIAGVLLTRS